ncbi:lptD [Symbiodinium microadriaticum]|nr:lptD [Symbiodinium microadriaticum]
MIAMGMVLALCTALVLMVDTLDLTRRAEAHPNVGATLIIQMSLMKLPNLIEQTLPFIVLFGAMWTFIRLTRSHELAVTRAAGVSIWQLLAPPIGVALLIGSLTISVFNPISAALIEGYTQLEAKHLQNKTGALAISKSGFWLRQADERGQSVVHALRVSERGVTLHDVIMFLYDDKDSFSGRIDAKIAALSPGEWTLQDAWVINANDPAPAFHATYRLQTDLTADRIQESFAAPETLSFWELPAFIETLRAAGFSANRHSFYWHSVLSIPLFLSAMVLVAATFSLRLARQGGIGGMILGCVLAGFGFYFLADIAGALGMSGTIPPVLAAWDGVDMTLPPVTLTAPDADIMDNPAAVGLEADRVYHDQKNNTVWATGNVEIELDGRLMQADSVSYNLDTGEVTAEGNVYVKDETGHVITADKAILENEFRTGAIEGLRLELAEGGWLTAEKAVRESLTRSRLETAAYSPCEVCEDNPTPTWQVSAEKVTHDVNEQTIYYQNAVFEFLGLPVFYLPYLSHADPTVKQRSGFLAPSFSSSTELGASVAIPYYWGISPSRDLTITPIFMTEENPFVEGEFRDWTRWGRYDFEGGITYVEKRDDQNNRTGDDTFRSYIFGGGAFKSGPWRYEFRVENSSDDTFLRRYDISNLQTLTSSLFLGHYGPNHTFEIDSYYFQGLRQQDKQGQTPYVFPRVSYSYRSPGHSVFGGHMAIDAGLLVLGRTAGADMTRASLDLSWNLPRVFNDGSIIEFSAGGRADYYYTTDIAHPTIAGRRIDSEDERIEPLAALTWRKPFVRMSGNWRQTVEPIVMLVFADNSDPPTNLPNEDSLSFEFDETNLLALNKFPGRDRFEDGSRAAVAVRWGIYGPNGGVMKATLGQSFRPDQTNIFNPSNGLNERNSDIVGRVFINPFPALLIDHRFRLDRDDLSYRRNELTVSSMSDLVDVNAGYLRLDRELTQAGLAKREEIYGDLTFKPFEFWYLKAEGRRDLGVDERSISSRVALGYEDECFQFETYYRRRFNRNRDLEPNTSIGVKVNLRTLGN